MAAAPVHAVGAAQAALGRWGQAEAAFKEAVRRAPRDAAYLVDLGRACAQLGRPEAALQRLAEAAALGADVALHRARVFSDTCRDDDAAEVLETAGGASLDVLSALP
jgi:tetratricopeptide (TPR) repeat protein